MISNYPDKSLFNVGGMETFQFAPYQSISSLPAISSGQVSSAVEFLGSASFYQGYATLETLQFTETPTIDDNGTHYDWVITGFTPGDSPVLVDLMSSMEACRHIVVTKDLSGVLRLVGYNAPLYFTAVFTPGNDTKSARGYTFTFSGSSAKRAPVYPLA